MNARILASFALALSLATWGYSEEPDKNPSAGTSGEIGAAVGARTNKAGASEIGSFSFGITKAELGRPEKMHDVVHALAKRLRGCDAEITMKSDTSFVSVSRVAKLLKQLGVRQLIYRVAQADSGFEIIVSCFPDARVPVGKHPDGLPRLSSDLDVPETPAPSTPAARPHRTRSGSPVEITGEVDNRTNTSNRSAADRPQATPDYNFPAKVKWEALMVRKDNYRTLDEAFRVIAAMGNEVSFGAPLPAIAKRSSQGFNAKDGGAQEWTTQGALASKALDEAIFALPEGKLSQILEDERGLYVVRVIERATAGRTPFEELNPPETPIPTERSGKTPFHSAVDIPDEVDNHKNRANRSAADRPQATPDLNVLEI